MDSNKFIISSYGVKVPRIIYGTAWKKDSTAKLVEQAIGLGFRGIDTASQPKHYNEAGVGDGLARCLKTGLNRDEIYIQSKFTSLNGQDPKNIPYDSKASLSEQVAQSFQVSLKNLQTTYLDSLVLHSPLANKKQFLQVWQVMENIFDKGDAKQLGISNCYSLQQLEWLYQTVNIYPAVIQNRFYADTQYDQAIRTFCQQQNIIYQSFWTLSANPRILANPIIQTLATKYQRSAAQIFFRYLSLNNIVPLTGTQSEIHMQEDLDIFEFDLSEDECIEISTLLNRSSK